GRKSTIVYRPCSSLTATRTRSMSAVLAACTVTPGRMPPPESLTMPEMALCAETVKGIAANAITAETMIVPDVCRPTVASFAGIFRLGPVEFGSMLHPARGASDEILSLRSSPMFDVSPSGRGATRLPRRERLSLRKLWPQSPVRPRTAERPRKRDEHHTYPRADQRDERTRGNAVMYHRSDRGNSHPSRPSAFSSRTGSS